MHKIFKYTFDENGVTQIPLQSEIIRMDHVDDGFYKGDFVWAIVDTDKLSVTREVRYQQDSIPAIPHGAQAREIAVKEKQIISNFYPSLAREVDGKLYVYGCEDLGTEYEICVFKTGQPIDVDISSYSYIGLCRLWIVQELGLYTFAKKIR